VNSLDLAKFCVEELILLNPENYAYHIQYAELCHSLSASDATELESAKQYYAQALELCPNNLRALYGLCLCCRQTLTSESGEKKSKSKKVDEHSLEVASGAYKGLVKQILAQYSSSKAPSHMIELVTNALTLDEADT